MKKTAKRIFGDKGEEFVANYLRKNGYVISAKNYKSRYGEIDIIAENNNMILFVEVKTRSKEAAKFISPAECVSDEKQQRIIATAQYYILNNGVGLQPRFDIAEVITEKSGDMSEATLNYIEDAFGEF